MADTSAPREIGIVATLLIGGTVAGFKVAQSKMGKWIYSTVPLSIKLECVPEWLRK